MVEHNEENIEKLATKLVDDWDLDTLMQYAAEMLSEHYKADKEAFEKDWKNEFEGDSDDGAND